MGEQEEKFPAQWAIDLLRGPTIYKEKFYNKHLTEMICTFTGVCTVYLRNYFADRPLRTGLPYQVAFGIGGYIVGRVLTHLFDLRAAKRDAMMVDYIKRHPERFPEPRNKKVAEIFEPWFPIR